MYKICKTQQSAQRQRYISDVLFQMLRRNKLDAISICALCQKAKIPRRTFYRYFDTLRDVVQYRFDSWREDFAAFKEEHKIPADASPVQKMEQFLIFWEDQAEFLEAIYYNNFLSGLAGEIITANLHVPDLRRQPNGQDSRATSEAVLYFVIGGLMSVLIWDRDSRHRCSRAELAQILCRLMTSAEAVKDPQPAAAGVGAAR